MRDSKNDYLKLKWFFFFTRNITQSSTYSLRCSPFDERLEKIRTFPPRSFPYPRSSNFSVLFLFLARHVEYEKDKKKKKELEFNKRTAQKDFTSLPHDEKRTTSFLRTNNIKDLATLILKKCKHKSSKIVSFGNIVWNYSTVKSCGDSIRYIDQWNF